MTRRRKTRSAIRCSSWFPPALGGGALGDAVGAQVGAAVVGLMTNSVIGEGLLNLVDTIAGGLFGSQDVVDAWAEAAGRLAKAALVGIFRRCCRR